MSSLRSHPRSMSRARPAVAVLALSAILGLSALAPVSPALAQFSSSTSQTPNSFADIVDRVKGSVVSIYVVGGGAQPPSVTPPRGAPGRGQPPQPFNGIPGLPEDHPLNEFFKNLPRDFGGGGGNGGNMPTMAQGSGFVISDDGYVVTNNHVIENASKIQLAFDNQTGKVEAELVGTDARSDIALLKIKSPTQKMPFVKLATKDPRVGDWVIAIGNPFGFGGTVTAGIVSSLARDVPGSAGPYDYLQIDAAVNRGNSGGPTFNLDGEVIGVNTAIYSPSGGSIGIAFAVPAKTVNEVINQLKSSGSVSRGWLGVKIQNVDEDTAASLGLGETRGALVNEVTAGGPASQAGLQNGDAILSVNGGKVADSRDLSRKIAALAPSANADLTVLRGGKEQKIAVKLGDFKDANGPVSTPAKTDVPKPAATTDLQTLGLKLAAAKGGRDGVTIAEVESASDAALKGLRAGDVILEVSSQPVTSVDDVSKGLADATKLGRRAVLLRVRSGDQTRFVAVQIKKG